MGPMINGLYVSICFKYEHVRYIAIVNILFFPFVSNPNYETCCMNTFINPTSSLLYTFYINECVMWMFVTETFI